MMNASKIVAPGWNGRDSREGPVGWASNLRMLVVLGGLTAAYSIVTQTEWNVPLRIALCAGVAIVCVVVFALTGRNEPPSDHGGRRTRGFRRSRTRRGTDAGRSGTDASDSAVGKEREASRRPPRDEYDPRKLYGRS